MESNAALIKNFYTCFQRLDAEGMAACYHREIVFSDPVFPNLAGAKAGAMWKMLCTRARAFELSFGDVSADANTGRAHWEARYLFSKTGRHVHNKIDAVFEFKAGKIISHRDTFNFWKWSAMALGPPGLALGWSPMLRAKVQRQAAKSLDRFRRETGL